MGGKRENEVGLDWLSVRCLWAMQVGHPFGLWIDESGACEGDEAQVSGSQGQALLGGGEIACANALSQAG